MEIHIIPDSIQPILTENSPTFVIKLSLKYIS